MMVEGLNRLILKGVQKVGLHTWVLLIWLTILFVSIAVGLSNILYGQDSLYLSTIVILSLTFSWLLARSRSPGWLAGIILSFSGVMVILLSAGGLANPTFALSRSLVQFSGQVIHWQWNSPFPNPSLVIPLAQEAGEALGEVSADTLGWIQALLNGRPIFDRRASGLVWSALLWLTSCWAGWMVRRRGKPLLAALPGVALFAASLAYTRENAMYLFPALFGTLALKAWYSYSQRERLWVQTNTDYAEDLRFDSGMWSMAFIVMVTLPALLLASFSPQASIQQVRQLFLPERQTAAQVGAALGLETNPQSGAVPVNPGILPREHLLGAGPELSQRVVMIVRVDEQTATSAAQPPTCPDGSCEPLIPRLYWRAANYDFYTGTGWATSATNRQSFPKNRPVWSPPPESFQTIRQEIQVVGDPGQQAYYSGTFISADQAFQVEWRDNPLQDELFSVQLRRPPSRGDYQVISASPIIAENLLRNSPPDYPEWVTEFYLQLPESLPQRVVDLAQTLTVGLSTPYERAVAIEKYLRGVPYTLEVPEPPPDLDVVDYYLFDLGAGYCDYSASAMVVLARAAGLPARLVVGYAAGQFDPQYNAFVVTEADAHSWAELYFPRTGWVEFEPTAGQPALIRPEEMPTSPTAVSELPEPFGRTTGAAPWQWGLLVIGGLAVLLLLALYAWLALDAWRIGRLPGGNAAMALYQRLQRSAAHLTLSYQPGDTPSEYAQSISEEMARLALSSNSPVMRTAPSDIRRLTEYYEQAIYSRHNLDAEVTNETISIWRRLRRAFWIAWLIRKWRSIWTTGAHS